MEKTILVDSKEIKFKSTGAFLLRYKAQFHRDALKDIYKMQGAVKTEIGEDGEEYNVVDDMEKLDLEVFYDLIWTLAKTADPTIPDPFQWLDQFDEFPLSDIIPEVIDMIFSSIGATVESKKK